LLLKPQFIRETTTEIQKGKEGTEFKKRNYEDNRIMAKRDYHMIEVIALLNVIK
jgi:hypothetical protein